MGSFVGLQIKNERKPGAGVPLLMACESHPATWRNTAAVWLCHLGGLMMADSDQDLGGSTQLPL